MTWIALLGLIGIVLVALTVGVVAVVVRIANAHASDSPQASHSSSSSGARVIVIGLSVPLFLLALFVGGVLFLTVSAPEVAVETYATPATPVTANVESHNVSFRVGPGGVIDAKASLSHPRVNMEVSIPGAENGADGASHDAVDQGVESSNAGHDETEPDDVTPAMSTEQEEPDTAGDEKEAVADSDDPAGDDSNTDDSGIGGDDATAMVSTTAGLSERNLPEWLELTSEKADGELLRTFSSAPRISFEEAEADVRSKIEEELLANWKARHESEVDWEPSVEGVIPEEAVRDRHDEIAVFDMGAGQKAPMHIVHWRVAMTPEMEAAVEQQWRDYIVHLRMIMMGCAVVFLTVCTSTASGFFQLRKRFEGRHTFILAGIGLTIVSIGGCAALAAVRFLL